MLENSHPFPTQAPDTLGSWPFLPGLYILHSNLILNETLDRRPGELGEQQAGDWDTLTVPPSHSLPFIHPTDISASTVAPSVIGAGG